MCETIGCGFFMGGWFWIIPLVFMIFCFGMMFFGQRSGRTIGCMSSHCGCRDQTKSNHGETPAEKARHHYTEGEMDRQ